MEDNELRRRLNGIQNSLAVVSMAVGALLAIALFGVPDWLGRLIG